MLFPLFVLKQKSGAKKFKANGNRSAHIAAHAPQHATAFLNIHLNTMLK
jgi:hypothetical protein